jgi:hypothetical protein
MEPRLGSTARTAIGAAAVWVGSVKGRLQPDKTADPASAAPSKINPAG